jgi:hypothetical protein
VQILLDFKQGDQIGQIFAFWVIFSLGSFLINEFLATCLHGKSYLLILSKNVLSYILGDFVASSSGHLNFKTPIDTFCKNYVMLYLDDIFCSLMIQYWLLDRYVPMYVYGQVCTYGGMYMDRYVPMYMEGKYLI